ncbi:FHIPEP family type III secretion protein [Paracoccus contaminans]|uniref:Flagellar biosynthesis protein FlhA n=1 Tax=Paracoccus contaminans TaxID=1945662 RepID=A0A1W6CVN5_9RHOB|nr:FHIPEP family type III secretion protein [Paracoccus contaminans]ARJ68932.1 flagellar biosynthesis protein FlhA [Paracoccus contaminans]
MSAAVAPVAGGIAASGKPLAITGGLVLVVMSMVIPMPAALLDVGIALSIATGTLILVMASVVHRPTDFQAFPVMLLISLLLRLSLNVSSTRLILTQGHTGPDAAGEVISGFSRFVAGGSLMVGITVFAVISIVNFMVITKGSGRMAEVSARFALDSLPGKQLAIDGDLNSGAITHDEAKRRRLQDQREISFYGSLDGASKFVKGDAVAGLIITAVNFFVGLGVGVVGHGLPIGEALATYSQLTIGDGLVSQVPALITSMAAALLLSRGGSTDSTADLLSQQFTQGWHAPALVAMGMVVLGFVPGMPTLVFLAIAGIAGLFAWRNARQPAAAAEPPPGPAAPAEDRPRIGDVLDTDEICVEIGPELIAAALDPIRGLGGRINNLRIHIARSFGVILPEVRITDAVGTAGGDYVIRVHGVVRARGQLHPALILALGSEDVLAGIDGERTREPVYDSPAKWISPSRQDEAALAGASVVTPMEVLSTHLMETVKSQLPALLTLASLQRLMQELRNLSDQTRAQAYQRVFDNMIPDKVTPEHLLSVLRILLEDRISIRNLPLIVEAIHESRAPDPETAAEFVRRRLRGQITEQLSDADGRLDIVQLQPAWEAEFQRADAEAGRGGGTLAPPLMQRMIERLRVTAASLPPEAQPALVVPDHRRRMVRAMVAAAGLGWPVLGIEEVDPQARVRLLGTVEP